MAYQLTRIRQIKMEVEELDDPTSKTFGDNSANAQESRKKNTN